MAYRIVIQSTALFSQVGVVVKHRTPQQHSKHLCHYLHTAHELVVVENIDYTQQEFVSFLFCYSVYSEQQPHDQSGHHLSSDLHPDYSEQQPHDQSGHHLSSDLHSDYSEETLYVSVDPTM